jgi:hypothetical protein
MSPEEMDLVFRMSGAPGRDVFAGVQGDNGLIY